MDLSSLRKEYKSRELLESQLLLNPIEQFNKWFQEALEVSTLEPNAMVLSTIHEGSPEARVVLLKGVQPDGFIFYTNYDSDKGKQLDENPNCSLTFNWLELERQVRIVGVAQKVSQEESNTYFNSRPRGSQIGAHTSPQSQIVKDRNVLEALFEEKKAFFEKKNKIPLPNNWGGYLIKPSKIEFWQGRPSRLHDRLVFEKNPNEWEVKRVAP